MDCNWKSFKLYLTAICATEKPDKHKLALLLTISESLLIVLMHYTDRIRKQMMATEFGIIYFFYQSTEAFIWEGNTMLKCFLIFQVHVFSENGF